MCTKADQAVEDSITLVGVDEQRQDGQLEPTYSSSVPILDVTQKTCQKQ